MIVGSEVGTRKVVLAFALAFAAVMAGCTPTEGRALEGAMDYQTDALFTRADQGTEIFAGTATVIDQECDGETGVVIIGGTLTTTGSVDSVEIRASIDGGEEDLVGLILPQDFVHDGRIKTAEYAVTISLPSGTHSVEICFYQSGSQGREPKQTCADPVTVVVDCEANCRGTGFFGDLVGNPSLCRGNGPPHIPVHVKGDLGDAPSLFISGPNSYTHQATMNHAGESCVYQYNWDTEGNGGAGQYTFTVTGNSNTFTFTATLHCR